MISWGDLYSVMSAVVPLYVAMLLAYGSVKWWGVLSPPQCGGINRFVSIFAVPLLSFQFIAENNPYTMNFRFIAADVVSKLAVLLVLAIWVRFWRNGKLEWLITIFVLTTIPNTLVVGTPLLAAMYGEGPGDLTVQAVVLQCTIWYTLLLLLYEYRAAQVLIRGKFPDTAASIISFKVDSDVMSLDGRREPVLTETEIGDNGKLHVKVRRSVSTAGGGGGGVHIAADHSACMQMSSGRSLGLTSLADTIAAAAARPSNLTGAEIYSLHSSVNLTPRDSSFNQNDFYKMMQQQQQQAGRFSPPAYDHHRQSNVTATSDVYSLHDSSRGITPRTSNFNEESSKDYLQYSYPKPGGAAAAAAAAAAAVPCSINNYSPQFTSSQITKRIMDPPHSAKASASLVSSSSLVDENAKELHMFVWSANASPISESRGGGGGGGQLHVFGGCEFNTPDYAQEYDAKEVQMFVHSHHHAQYQAPPNATGPREAKQQLYEEYIHDDFSFGNRHKFRGEEDTDKYGPRLDSNFRSSSTAELTQKVEDDEAKRSNMPPPTVMLKLISVMTFRKLIRNPNTYSSLIGVVWSLISYRWNFQMPRILYNSVHILSDAGLGMAMFSLGLFMGLQDRVIVCGWPRAIYGMVLRFLFGPGAFAAASYLVGLRGVSLNVAIVQAALPLGIVPFVFAKEYNVHADIMSTGVIFGILVALPVTLLYYILLGL